MAGRSLRPGITGEFIAALEGRLRLTLEEAMGAPLSALSPEHLTIVITALQDVVAEAGAAMLAGRPENMDVLAARLAAHVHTELRKQLASRAAQVH